jgi:hypothetical protein
MLLRLDFRTKFPWLLSWIYLWGAFVSVDNFLLPKIECHYSERGMKCTSILHVPVPACFSRTERPKGALMQTAFACGRDLAPCTATRGVPAPLTQTNPARVGCRERVCVQSRRERAALPLSTPSQPCAGWIRGRAFAPCTTTRSVPAPSTQANRAPVGCRERRTVPSRFVEVLS